jgi:hypothetical protein
LDGEEFRKRFAIEDEVDDMFNPGQKMKEWILDTKKKANQELCAKYTQCLARTHPNDKKLFVKLLKAHN